MGRMCVWGSWLGEEDSGVGSPPQLLSWLCLLQESCSGSHVSQVDLGHANGGLQIPDALGGPGLVLAGEVGGCPRGGYEKAACPWPLLGPQTGVYLPLKGRGQGCGPTRPAGKEECSPCC